MESFETLPSFCRGRAFLIFVKLSRSIEVLLAIGLLCGCWRLARVFSFCEDLNPSIKMCTTLTKHTTRLVKSRRYCERLSTKPIESTMHIVSYHMIMFYIMNINYVSASKWCIAYFFHRIHRTNSLPYIQRCSRRPEDAAVGGTTLGGGNLRTNTKGL